MDNSNCAHCLDVGTWGTVAGLGIVQLLDVLTNGTSVVRVHDGCEWLLDASLTRETFFKEEDGE